tara:strand:- start:508 stop:1086 length:579 start_codon:yes stop_codon:yes gene_type:complete
MSEVYYTFFLESEPGIPAGNLDPSFNLIKRIPDGTSLGLDFYTIDNLGEGLYGFRVDWNNDAFLLSEEESIKKSLFVKIDTGLEMLDQKFISMRLERHDFLPDLVDSVQTVADSLVVSAEALDAQVKALMALEEGHWIIDNHRLLIYTKETPRDQMGIGGVEPLVKFSLYDQEGVETSENIYQRFNLEEFEG